MSAELGPASLEPEGSPAQSQQQKKGFPLSRTTKDILAGTSGGVAQVLAGQPFDIVKVRLQTSPAGTYSGMADCAKALVKEDGLRGFYKGTLTPLLGVGLCVSIQFGVLEDLKRRFSAMNIKSGATNAGGRLSNGQYYIAGGLAGLANSVAAGPIEHIRIRLQSQPAATPTKPLLYNGPGDAIVKIYKQAGFFRGIYKGMGPTFLREGHGLGIYFLTYEWLVNRKLDEQKVTRSEMPAVYAVLYGIAAGWSLWLTAYPIDVIKSRLQTDGLRADTRKYASAFDCARQIYAAGGIGGFFRGLIPTLIRSPIANGATFLAFEMAMRYMG